MASGACDTPEVDVAAKLGFKSGDLCRVLKSTTGFTFEPGWERADPKHTLYGGPGQRVVALNEGDIVLIVSILESDSAIVSKGDGLCIVAVKCLQHHHGGFSESI